MNKEINIQGMHCNSCKALIRMEIEELGYGDKIKSLELAENNSGKLELNDVTDADIEKVAKVINQMDQYKVIT